MTTEPYSGRNRRAPPWGTPEDVAREWDNIRWARLEPRWLLARQLLSGGWGWNNSNLMALQVGALGVYLDDVSSLSRKLVHAYQIQGCIEDLNTVWGIHRLSSGRGSLEKRQDRAQQIAGSEGYRTLYEMYERVCTKVERLEEEGVRLTDGVLDWDQYREEWGSMNVFESLTTIREMLRRLEATAVRLGRRWTEAPWSVLARASLRFHPEVFWILSSLSPETLTAYYSRRF